MGKVIYLFPDEYPEDMPQWEIDELFAPEEPFNDLPEPPRRYRGSERFNDWTATNLIWHEPGEPWAEFDPKDPHKFAHHFEEARAYLAANPPKDE